MMSLPSGVHTVLVLCGIERQAGERLPSEIPHPDVDLVAPDIDGDTCSVGRQTRIGVAAGRGCDRLLTAAPIDPHQTARRFAACGQIDQRAGVADRKRSGIADPVDDRGRVPDDFEATQIEADRPQCAAADEDDVTRRHETPL